MSAINMTLSGHMVTLSGELTRTMITSGFINQSRKMLAQKTLVIDLSQVSKIDTAGLAWLLLLVEHAKQDVCQLSFKNLPEDLLKLAKLSAVDLFIPTEN